MPLVSSVEWVENAPVETTRLLPSTTTMAPPRRWPAGLNVAPIPLTCVFLPYSTGVMDSTDLVASSEVYGLRRPVGTRARVNLASSFVGSVAYTAVPGWYLRKMGRAPMWSRWAWLNSTASASTFSHRRTAYSP